MAALPYMQFYVADYLADTMHLTVEEHGAYLLLLMNYWQTGKPLPDDDMRLQCVCRANAEQWQNMRATIAEFFEVKDGFWVHRRVESDLEKVRTKSRSAQKAALARHKKSGKSTPSNERTANALRTQCHTDTDTDTDTDTEIPNNRERERLTTVETRARNAPPVRSPGEAPPESGSPNGGSDPPPGPDRPAMPHSIPDGWQPKPAALSRLAFLGAPEPTPDHVAAFVAHYQARGQPMADWDAAFVKWMIREKAYGNGKTSNGGKSRKLSPAEQAREDIRQLAANGQFHD